MNLDKLSTQVSFSKTQYAALMNELHTAFIDSIKESIYIKKEIPTWETLISRIRKAKELDIPFKEDRILKMFINFFVIELKKKDVHNIRRDFIYAKGKIETESDYASILFTSILNKYTRQYSPKDQKQITIGGGKNMPHKYHAGIILWILGYESADVFFEKHPSSNEENKATEDIIESLQHLFERKNDWEELPNITNLEGMWRVEAMEDELHVDSVNDYNKKFKEKRAADLEKEKKKKGYVESETEDILDVELPQMHKSPIEYRDRFCYWGDVKITPSKHKGFFIGEGFLKTNTNVEELDNWKLQFICSLRKSDEDAVYVNMDYEMTPRKGIKAPRTFGYCMFDSKLGSNNFPRFEGYYFSNRLRLPEKPEHNDPIFIRGLRISMGRVVFYKLN